MKYKVAFLDRDGTINVDKGYLYRIEDFEFLPGVLEGLKQLQEEGYLLIIVTNQSGIGRGYYTVQSLEKLHKWMMEKLESYGIKISGIYYCPHLPDAKIQEYRCECSCRKPRTGLYWQAIHQLKKKYELDLENSVVIGDKERDLSICEEIGAKGIIIREDISSGLVHVARNFMEAVSWILEE